MLVDGHHRGYIGHTHEDIDLRVGDTVRAGNLVPRWAMAYRQKLQQIHAIKADDCPLGDSEDKLPDLVDSSEEDTDDPNSDASITRPAPARRDLHIDSDLAREFVSFVIDGADTTVHALPSWPPTSTSTVDDDDHDVPELD